MPSMDDYPSSAPWMTEVRACDVYFISTYIYKKKHRNSRHCRQVAHGASSPTGSSVAPVQRCVTSEWQDSTVCVTSASSHGQTLNSTPFVAGFFCDGLFHRQHVYSINDIKGEENKKWMYIVCVGLLVLLWIIKAEVELLNKSLGGGGGNLPFCWPLGEPVMSSENHWYS